MGPEPMVQRGLSMPAEVWSFFDREARPLGLKGTQLARHALVTWKRERERWAESQAVSPRDDETAP